jgi:hypothetical protein
MRVRANVASVQRCALIAACAVTALAVTVPASASAQIVTFGSSLSVPATLNTADNLAYAGSSIGTIQNGQGLYIHVGHDGADTALWNQTLGSGEGSPAAPQAGQVTNITIEGCAEPAPGGPAPLTQVHFQDLQPAGGGAVKVNVTSQPFDVPVCGGSVTAATKTSYQPTNFCVNAGDYVDFNDEGGFDPNYYPSGVQYEFMGSVAGATTNSFIRGDQTDNGDTFSPGDTAPTNGFASNGGQELLLQATLATGTDATPLCPGGTHGQPGQPGGKPGASLPASISIDHAGLSRFWVYCALLTPCSGSAAVVIAGKPVATIPVSVRSAGSATVQFKEPQWVLKLVRKSKTKPVAGVITLTLQNAASVTTTIVVHI